MKLAPLGELQKYFVACRRSDVTPTIAARSATVDMEGKGDPTRESALYARVLFHKICDHSSTKFSEEVP
jgi:hypothetical protein